MLANYKIGTGLILFFLIIGLVPLAFLGVNAYNTASAALQAEAENKLDKSTNIEINTIHATKGREADNVVVLPDMSGITYKGMLKDPDNEHRVFYVAATRAKQKLYLHTPVTTQFYKLPR